MRESKFYQVNRSTNGVFNVIFEIIKLDHIQIITTQQNQLREFPEDCWTTQVKEQ